MGYIVQDSEHMKELNIAGILAKKFFILSIIDLGFAIATTVILAHEYKIPESKISKFYSIDYSMLIFLIL